MSKPGKPKFYVVWQGRKPGVYSSWSDASEQVSGYPKAEFKSFATRQEAETAFRGRYWDYAGQNAAPPQRSLEDLKALGVNLNSVAVDAACAGVPGPMEYRGVDVATGRQLFHVGPLDDGTNNIGEFLAIVHALALLKEQGRPDIPIYSDSVNAQLWVRARACRTNLVPSPRNAPIFELIRRAVEWLKNHDITNPILKWETDRWGEIPADFGRK